MYVCSPQKAQQPSSPVKAKTVTERRKLYCTLPHRSQGSVFDIKYSRNVSAWVPWMAGLPPFVMQPNTPFASIIVPTVDTTRTMHVVHTYAHAAQQVLVVGRTGTGKSVLLEDQLLAPLRQGSKHKVLVLRFSARTSASAVHASVTQTLKKRRKEVLGPPVGTRLVVFIDDLNMPALDKYGSQPPIELVRQWMDHEGWYSHDKGTPFHRLVDMQFVAAMAPPGGGRNEITPRLLRHFGVVAVTPFDHDTLGSIFVTILEHFFAKSDRKVKVVIPTVVAASVELYLTVIGQLRPTPSTSHYTYNLRDLASVFQGMTQVQGERIQDQVTLLRLWCHEAQRALRDRLTSEADRSWFDSVCRGTLVVLCADCCQSQAWTYSCLVFVLAACMQASWSTSLAPTGLSCRHL